MLCFLCPVIYTIEFQKRGLPHAHIVLFLHPDDKLSMADDIDRIISAELPDPSTDPELFAVVRDRMMHGPCGAANRNSPCMEAGKCNKHFPKRYVSATHFDTEGFPYYRRRDDGIQVKKNGVYLDNRYVVPYNRDLLLRYKAHINVEACNQSRSIKYLFKYISKGPDRITAAVCRPRDTDEGVDEIKRFYDCRYISPCEAVWRLFKFDIHYRTPSVERLTFHLLNQQSIMFQDDDHLDSVMNTSGHRGSMFLEWMKSNAQNVEGRSLTYCEYPSKFVWNVSLRKWTLRKRGFSLGRIFNVSPGNGELYYLRLMLNEVRGATSYEDLRTLDGVTYPTFKDACYSLGLIDDEKEYIDGIIECSRWGSAHYLRSLFAMLLLTCTLTRPEYVWGQTWHLLADDILYNQRRRLRFDGIILRQIITYLISC